MNSQELALRIHELRSVISFLVFVGYGLLLVFGKEIVDALWYWHQSKKETEE